MANQLLDLIGATDPHAAIALRDLELATQNKGVDTRLIADIMERAHSVMRTLNLDIANTTPEELYHALDATVAAGKVDAVLDGTDFIVFRLDSRIVSLNKVDVIENSHHQLSFGQHTASQGQKALRDELLRRYHEATGEPERVYRHAETLGAEKPDNEKEKEPVDKQPYILSIGEIFTDAFIELNEDVARVDTDANGEKRLSLPFGSKPPYNRVDVVQSVGPSPNAAVSIARLGVNSGLMAYLGDDMPGADSIAYLKKEKVDTSTISVQKSIKSNYYYVLRYGAERTILVHDEEYDYTWQEPAEVPDWIYLSLISDKAWQLHEDLLAYLDKHPETKLAFQPGTFHFKWGVEKLARIYKRSHIIILNREEAVDVTGKSYDDLHALANGLHELGPQIVVITDGPNGSYASFDWKLVTIPNYPDPAPPFDRTGAGDAFASTIVAALAMGETMETALTWAPINSMSVVQKIGAQAGLLSREGIQEWLDKAPDDYVVTQI